jgi:hypothetical protein
MANFNVNNILGEIQNIIIAAEELANVIPPPSIASETSSYLISSVLTSNSDLNTISSGVVSNVSYQDLDTLQLNQSISATLINPIQVPITSNSSSPLLATAPNNIVTSIAATQPNDISVTPVGNEPPHAFRGQYPYVKTNKSESGHIHEVDDTPGHERTLDYHRTGTYQEINQDGRRVVKVVNDNYTIIAQNDSLHVEGTMTVYVRGNINVVCLNDVSLNIGGRLEINAGDDIRIKGKSISLESASGDVNIYSAGAMRTHSAQDTTVYSLGKLNQHSSSDMNFYSLGGLNFSSTANTNVMASGIYLNSNADTNILSNGKLIASSTGQASILTKDKVTLDGTTVHFNEGLSSNAAAALAASDSEDANQTGLSAAPSRETVSVPSVEEGILQGTDDQPDSAQKAIDQAVASGRLTQDQAKALTTIPEILSTDSTPGATIKPVSTDASAIANLPDASISTSMQLSQNYKLSSLTNAGPHFPYPLAAQHGRSKARIAANLQLLAVNVLEPILAKWGPIQINSCFRAAGAQSGTVAGKISQHELGMAADITYGSRSTDLATTIQIAEWIRDHVAFDQLIIEYGTSQIWTHVSFNGESVTQRKQVLSCPYPLAKQYVPGLVQVKWTPR